MAPLPEQQPLEVQSKAVLLATSSSEQEIEKQTLRLQSRFAFITQSDYEELSKAYDKKTSILLNDDEIQSIITDYNEGKLAKESRVYEIMKKYDLDGEGFINLEKIDSMKHASLNDSDLRYIGYTRSLGKKQ
jgi:hypothetical protein